MALYEDDVYETFHNYVGDGMNVRHALAQTIADFGPKIVQWAKVVVEREIEGDEDPRDVETRSG